MSEKKTAEQLIEAYRVAACEYDSADAHDIINERAAASRCGAARAALLAAIGERDAVIEECAFLADNEALKHENEADKHERGPTKDEYLAAASACEKVADDIRTLATEPANHSETPNSSRPAPKITEQRAAELADHLVDVAAHRDDPPRKGCRDLMHLLRVDYPQMLANDRSRA